MDEGNCDGGTKPSSEESCNIKICPPQWFSTPWSKVLLNFSQKFKNVMDIFIL